MSITKHLPSRKEETKPTLVHIPVSLREAIDQARSEDGLTITEIVIAGLKSYLDDRVRSRRRKE
mgnify:CR=1 FL=1